jgi:molybdopterin/thiamine biosynthesis adenylyltransferase
MAELSDKELKRYARQLILPQVDLEGQARLKQSRVLIVGAGGLGTPSAQYLAGAGVGTIRIADDDRIELSNLPRQLAFAEQDIGQFKADVLAQRLRAANGDISVDARVTRFDEASASQLLEGVDLVLDATDSLQARLDIDRSTFTLGRPWIMGAALRISGQWAFFDGGREQGCYHCLTGNEYQPEGEGCAELGILGPVVGLVALQQSVLAIQYLLGTKIPFGHLSLMDAWTGEYRRIALAVRPDCALCQARH